MLSQERLAEQAGINRGVITRLEQGRIGRAWTIARLARALGVSVAELSMADALAGPTATPPTARYRAPALRALRLAQNLSRQDLARQAHVVVSAIANLEAAGKARAGTLHKLAAVLQVEPAILMAGAA